MKFALVYIVAVIVIIFGVNQWLAAPFFAQQKPKEIINPQFEKKIAHQTTSDTTSLEHHHQLLTYHFGKPAYQATPTANIYRNDKAIEQYYSVYANHKNDDLRDIGHLGLGIIYFHKKQWQESGEAFDNIKSKSRKYISNARGEYYLAIGAAWVAEKLFKQEIKLKGAVHKAYQNLIKALSRQQKWNELDQLLHLPQNKAYLAQTDPEILAYMYFSQGKAWSYAQVRVRLKTNAIAIIASWLITMVWLVYLTRIKCFAKPAYTLWLGCFVGAVLSTFLAFPLYDYYHLKLGFYPTGGLFNDFLYCIAAIGLIEEGVKFLPVIVILWFFPKSIKEPIDYILLASVAALGFAATENLLYLAKDTANIIHRRAFFSVVSHLFDSSVIAYGLVLARYRSSKRPLWLQGLLYWGLAACAHGFFDFWLINPVARLFFLFTFGFMVLSMALWMSFMNNALNISPLFDYQKVFSSDHLKRFLVVSLTIILLFDYVSTALLKGAEVANTELNDTLFFALFFMGFLSTSLANFDLVRGYWQPLYKTSFFKKPNYNYLIGEKIQLSSRQNPEVEELFPQPLVIGTRLVFDDETTYFRLDLPAPVAVASHTIDTLILFVKYKNGQPKYNDNLGVRLFLADLPELENPKNTIFRKDKLNFWLAASACLVE
ncbi:PrsW family intramembrane metalloprotease [uncultured Microscilla sp.]|uniref:PrsW family intramembrane metalloprotease n=1 Tax=uncultured Microscilla sp. TaxID=432653 RepID=UPI0026240512|nr:PrsW family intramembrane metalloprotease [uncultured Microscilla sp.]